MKKRTNSIIGIAILVVAILTMGIDRIFVAADTASYARSFTVLTIISLICFLIGAIWLFKTVFD